MAKSLRDEAVLFVDDEESILNALKRELTDEKYRCLFALSGSQALGIIQQEKVSVIVSDIRMPEMDGLKLLNVIKDEYPSIVRVAFSGYTQIPELLVTINQAEVFKFLTKPWGSELKSVIHEALAYHRLLADRRETGRLCAQRSDARGDNTVRVRSSQHIFAAIGMMAFKLAEEALASPERQAMANQLAMASSLLQALSKLDFDDYTSMTVRSMYEDFNNMVLKGNVIKVEADTDAFSKIITIPFKVLSGLMSTAVENLTEYPHDYVVKIKLKANAGKFVVTLSIAASDSRYVPTDGYIGQRTYLNMLNTFASRILTLLDGEFLGLIANGTFMLKFAIRDYAQ